jgi:hypothetical protein
MAKEKRNSFENLASSKINDVDKITKDNLSITSLWIITADNMKIEQYPTL